MDRADRLKALGKLAEELGRAPSRPELIPLAKEWGVGLRQLYRDVQHPDVQAAFQDEAETPETIEARLRSPDLRTRLEALRDLLISRLPESKGTALTSATAQIRTLNLDLAEMDGAGDGEPVEDYTPEEWRAKLENDAREATDPDLELFVVEWLTRHPGWKVIGPDGEVFAPQEV